MFKILQNNLTAYLKRLERPPNPTSYFIDGNMRSDKQGDGWIVESW